MNPMATGLPQDKHHRNPTQSLRPWAMAPTQMALPPNRMRLNNSESHVDQAYGNMIRPFEEQT